MNVQVQRNPTVLRNAMKAGNSGQENAATGIGVDAFSQIFEQMAAMMGLAGDGQGSGEMTEQQQQEEQPLMMQMVAEMLLANPSSINQIPWMESQSDATAVQQTENAVLQVNNTLLQVNNEAQQMLSNTADTQINALQQAVQAVQSNGKNMPPEVQQFLQNIQEAMNPQTAKQSRNVENHGSMDTDSNSVDATLENVTEGKTGENQNIKGMTEFQNKFQQSVREVQQALRKAGANSNEKQQIDVDKLQSDVNSNRFQTITQLKGHSLENLQEPSVADQIKQSVAQNLSQGNKEFVIKLKPEGMGEITVKLLEEPGKATTLSLIASNTETAKMINSELNSLRNALRPLQVEVHEAVTQQLPSQEQSGGGNPQNFAQSGMFGQQHSNQQRQVPGSWQGNGSEFFSESFVEESLQEQILDNSALDTYI